MKEVRYIRNLGYRVLLWVCYYEEIIGDIGLQILACVKPPPLVGMDAMEFAPNMRRLLTLYSLSDQE